MGFVILAIIVIAFIVVITNISVVQQSRAYVIERLGAFHSVWGVGMHFKVPFIDRIARRVSLKEQVLDYPPQPVITKDNVTMQIDTVVYFQITDPKLYAYGVEQLTMFDLPGVKFALPGPGDVRSVGEAVEEAVLCLQSAL